MAKLRFEISMSVDGFTAGPSQSVEHPLNVVPVLLGDGTRLFDNIAGADVKLQPVRVVEAPRVTHLKYRVVK